MSSPFLDRISTNYSFVRVAILVAAGLWGLFWIPLRELGETGFSAAWSTTVFYLFPFLLMMPIALYRWRSIKSGGASLFITGLFLGTSMTLYSNAYFFTDVVRVLLLYYLLPIWGTILARVFLNEPITGPRILAIILGFSGMLTIFGIGESIPWPKNIGDWMALLAGVVWAVETLLTRTAKDINAFDTTFCFLGWAVITAMASSMIPAIGMSQHPDIGQFLDVLPWMVFVSLVLVIPVCLVIIWGAGILDPGYINVLFLSEISVGVIGASLLTDEVFGARELIGVILISAAGLGEIVFRGNKKHEVSD